MAEDVTVRLPDFQLPDQSVAVVIEADHVFVLRHLGYRGIWYGLPHESVEKDETPEICCLRSGLDRVRKAAIELADQLKVDLEIDRLSLAVRMKVGDHVERDGSKTHYFLVDGSGRSILAGPGSQPTIDPARGTWKPYEWIPVSALRTTNNFYPPEAVHFCELAWDVARAGPSERVTATGN